MRIAVGLFGFMCGLIVIGLVGRYGFKSTDIEADAWIMAFLFGAVAAGGLFGHGVAVRLWRHSKVAALCMGFVSIAALMLNLSNSLGAIAGRSDQATMERVSTNRAIRAAEAELQRLTELRDALPPFVQTDAAAVEAAQLAAEAAANMRKAECADGKPSQRGRNCRDREADERAANDRLAQTTAAKAATDRALSLEARAQEQRNKLTALGPIVTVDVQGTAIAKLFRLPDNEASFLATAQQFGLAAVVELIILMCVVSWEVLAPEATPRVVRRTKDSEEQPQAAVVAEPSAPTRLTPPRPQLVSTSTEPPAGPVHAIMAAVLEPMKGARVELGLGYVRYTAECKAQNKKPVDPDVYAEAVAKFCAVTGIKAKIEGDKLYLMNVQLNEPASQIAEG